MGKRVRLKRGDIYRFDLDEARYGLGQVVEPGGVFYTTVLRSPVPHDFVIDQIDTTDILLCGWTMDALLFHGRWHIVGNSPVPDREIPKPCSKMRNGGKPWISDFRATLLRSATPQEWEQLDQHSSHAPIIYQNAFKAHHGAAPKEPYYDIIGIEHVRAQAAICSA
jgi:hypothetical protein